MKISKKAYAGILMVLTCFVIMAWLWESPAPQRALTNEVILEGKTNKETYILGEPVTFQFEFTNKGSEPVSIVANGIDAGTLRVFAAGENGEFKKISGYGWGLGWAHFINLEPGQSHKFEEASVLWNGKPDVSHLSKYAQEQELKGKILTDYIFQEPGVYLVKAITSINKGTAEIESRPIQISVSAPLGDDLKIWNQVKGNRDIALLLQAGTFSVDNADEKAKLIKKVEQIIEKYPNSFYTGYLKPNLEKFKADEIRRKELREKTMIKQ